MLLPSENPIKCHEEVLSWQPMFQPTKRFDNYPPCLEDAQKVYVCSDFSLNYYGTSLNFRGRTGTKNVRVRTFPTFVSIEAARELTFKEKSERI